VISDLNSKNPDLPSVSIAKVIPNISTDELFSYKKCFIGISLENPVFEGDSFCAILHWIVEKFDQTLVVVGDYLCRYNELILNGSDEDMAAKASSGLGDSFILKTEQLFERLLKNQNDPKEKIRLTRWQSHLETDEYKKSKTILDNLFLSDPGFRAAVEKDASGFVKRLIKRNKTLVVSGEKALRLSCEYLLEEIAVFSALSEQGWRVELYPGSELGVLVYIARGKCLNVPHGLTKRISVELKIAPGRSSR